MNISPTPFDLWFVSKMAERLGKHPVFDLCVQSAIAHNVLGGFWFAAALFVLWVQSAALGQEKRRRRLLTTLVGSGLAILFTVPLPWLIQWLPPSHNPALAHFYPDYLDNNPNLNSFPSQSTAVYSAIAAGLFSLSGWAGGLLWVGIIALVALPRIYMGGHYPSDVLVGLTIGLAAYVVARACENRFSSWLQAVFQKERLAWLANAVIFIWILQVATEFRDAAWAQRAIAYFLK